MGIGFVVEDKVLVKVEGKDTGADGVLKPWDFTLTCKRLPPEELEARRTTDQRYEDFMSEVTEGWKGPREANGEPTPYSDEAFRRLLATRTGLPALCFASYVRAVAVKEKN